VPGCKVTEGIGDDVGADDTVAAVSAGVGGKVDAVGMIDGCLIVGS
jgi:hypothetical protein